ncbi:MAG TPA: HAMP domain-containing sensor histidine kinase [Pirellulales bacterium]|nr:HAMP domain-containing sensor histidine kinase [Pirellulales bacterium]
MKRTKAAHNEQEDKTPGIDADLQTVLTAWHDATVRWEQAHEQLQAEVRRLSAALASHGHDEKTGHSTADVAPLAARVARKVRSSVAPVSLYLNLLRRRLLDDEYSLDLLRKADRCCADVDACLEDLLHLTAERPPMLRTVNLRSLVEDVHASLRSRLLSQGVATTVDVPQQASALVDYEMLRQAVYNLELNALDAMPEGGELVVTSHTGAGAVELEIADSGTGLCDEARRRAFEPFFSTKNRTGLGLSVVQRLLSAHGGSVSATNCAEGGAAFTLRIPRRAMEVAA